MAIGGEDRRVEGITAGMPTGTGLAKFQAADPDRFIDVGSTEQQRVTLATGLGHTRMRPASAPAPGTSGVASVITSVPRVPLRTSIASSSVSLSALAPNFSKRSCGRSPTAVARSRLLTGYSEALGGTC